MNDIQLKDNANMESLAMQLIQLNKNIILIFAFNGTGKTRLSVALKDVTKAANGGKHSGVYYNAYSEDLFVWDNDTENDEQNIRLVIKESSLNQFHALLKEEDIREKLKPYNPKYDFKFILHEDTEQGIESIEFYMKDEEEKEDGTTIKISRGEERIFVWCFFLALFEVEGWADEQSHHFFVDDPVSSLDEHNIFLTASTLLDLIEKHFSSRKIIITTHHIGLFSILSDWLTRGEKSSLFVKNTEHYILKNVDGNIKLVNPKNNVFLYHLHLLQELKSAIDSKQLYTYHFVLLRQVLENISSFLGSAQFGFVLSQIGIKESVQATRNINTLSHQSAYRYQTETMVPDDENLFKEVFEKLLDKYKFKI